MEQDWKHLGRCIKRDRMRKGWRQPELANQSGLTVRTISTYETGAVPASAPEIPAGYLAVGRALLWPPDGVDRALAGQDPSTFSAPANALAAVTPSHGAAPGDLFPAVGRFARAAVAAGGDPVLRDLLEDVADRLLQSIPQRGTPAAQGSYGLAAYRPHAWAEGDPGVPGDDAARIQQAIEEHERGRREQP
ncbi:helix-turn-helix transcriptional regulator [Kitasatospora sp. NPDC091276]|uniref:helix-turn-helix domain-containing protein n=1 Tax=unclassified Kitasatospora TaxID=2633591 RepID=UPI0034440111